MNRGVFSASVLLWQDEVALFFYSVDGLNKPTPEINVVKDNDFNSDRFFN
ncbi:hypothetical protein PANA5342_4301 [Pantoea ananatis LMG 5342]|jgi:hypothetical protein|nr:hypothetical protein PANA5342_4301 [Pantoea ananatis LMG 5342]